MKNNSKCPIGTSIQSIIFSKDNFTETSAKSWAEHNDFKFGKTDIKENTIRIRQNSPFEYKKDSFRTIELTDGVKAVIGCPINKTSITKKFKGGGRVTIEQAERWYRMPFSLDEKDLRIIERIRKNWSEEKDKVTMLPKNKWEDEYSRLWDKHVREIREALWEKNGNPELDKKMNDGGKIHGKENEVLIYNLTNLKDSWHDFSQDHSEVESATKALYKDVVGEKLDVEFDGGWEEFKKAWEIILDKAKGLNEKKSEKINKKWEDDFQNAKEISEMKDGGKITWIDNLRAEWDIFRMRMLPENRKFSKAEFYEYHTLLDKYNIYNYDSNNDRITPEIMEKLVRLKELSLKIGTRSALYAYSDENPYRKLKDGGEVLSEEDELILYSIWGGKDYYEEDEDVAIKLAKEKYPNVTDEKLKSLFSDFLADNDDGYKNGGGVGDKFYLYEFVLDRYFDKTKNSIETALTNNKSLATTYFLTDAEYQVKNIKSPLMVGIIEKVNKSLPDGVGRNYIINVVDRYSNGGGVSEETYVISYLNKKKNFQQTDKEFKGKDAYEQAVKWGKKNLENFNSDMVRMKFDNGGIINEVVIGEYKYITSKEPIIENDWFIDSGKVFKAFKYDFKDENGNDVLNIPNEPAPDFAKITETTDLSLGLPIIKMADGGGVEFIEYKGHEIMFEPINKEYFVNDEEFNSLEGAKDYIDNGAKPSAKTINAYKHGAFDNGGKVPAEDKLKTANEIVKQLGGMGRLNAMTGAYNFIALPNGVSFKIKNARANYIKVTLTSLDLYDLEVGRIRGGKYTVIEDKKGLYNDMLKPAIEKATGMYLSLKDGGSIEDESKNIFLLNDADRINYIYNIITTDNHFSDSQLNFKQFSEYINVAIKSYLIHDKKNPIITKFGEAIYFEPLQKYIDEDGFNKAHIKYATHFISGYLVNGDNIDIRTFDKSKFDAMQILIPSLISPDVVRLYQKEDKDKKRKEAIIYAKEIVIDKVRCIILVTEITKEGEVRSVTFFPKRKCGFIQKQKDIGEWFDAPDITRFIEKEPPSDETQTMSTGGSISHSSNTKDTNFLGKNDKLELKLYDTSCKEIIKYQIIDNEIVTDSGIISVDELYARYIDNSNKMSDGGGVGITVKEFENKMKSLLKQENKWHFVGDVVDGKKVKMKLFVGKKEIDVQIFTIDDKPTRMPRNYSGKRDTLYMIMDNFKTEPVIVQEKISESNKFGSVVDYNGKKIYHFTVSFGYPIINAIRDLFLKLDGKVDKKIWDDTISVQKKLNPKYYTVLNKEWDDFKYTMEVKIEDGYYINPFLITDNEEEKPVEGIIVTIPTREETIEAIDSMRLMLDIEPDNNEYKNGIRNLKNYLDTLPKESFADLNNPQNINGFIYKPTGDLLRHNIYQGFNINYDDGRILSIELWQQEQGGMHDMYKVKTWNTDVIGDVFNGDEQVTVLEKFEQGAEVLVGGKADYLSLVDIAEMHKVSLDHILRQATIGMKIEREHSNDTNKIVEIVKDHLVESPDYYTKLQTIESSFENGGGVGGYYIDVPTEIQPMFNIQNLIKIGGGITSELKLDGKSYRYTYTNERDLDTAIVILNELKNPNYKKDMPQNLNQLKSYIQIGKLLRVSYNKNRPDWVGKIKVVVQTQTNGFYLTDGTKVPSDFDQNDFKKKSWLEYPKSNLISFSPFGFTFYAPDMRDKSKQIKFLQYEYVTGEQEEIAKNTSESDTLLYSNSVKMLEFVNKIYDLSDKVSFDRGGKLTPEMFNNGMEYNFDKESVSCFITAKNTGRMLVLRRAGNDYNGDWSLTSGGVEVNELPNETIKREIQEELGINLNYDSLIYVNSTKHPDRTHHYFELSVNEEFEPVLNPENDAYMWINLSELPDNTHPLLKKYINNDVLV